MDKNESFEQESQVKRVVLHPKWNIGAKKTIAGVKISSTHDIALLELTSPVRLNERVQPIAVDQGHQFQAGEGNTRKQMRENTIVMLHTDIETAGKRRQ